MPTFAEIQAELAMVLAIPEEDLTEEQRAVLPEYIDFLKTQERDKIDAFWGFIIEEAGRAEAIKAASKRLASKAATIQKRLDYLKGLYLHVMHSNGLKKVSGNAYTLSVRTDKKVDVFDQNLVPEEFLRIIPESREVDKNAAKAALKEGRDVPGCTLIETHSLRGS